MNYEGHLILLSSTLFYLCYPFVPYLLQFGSHISPHRAMCKGLAPSLKLLGCYGNFRRWGLMLDIHINSAFMTLE
jgi:hypothetical protein